MDEAEVQRGVGDRLQATVSRKPVSEVTGGVEQAAGRQLTPEDAPIEDLDASFVAYQRLENSATGQCSIFFFFFFELQDHTLVGGFP